MISPQLGKHHFTTLSLFSQLFITSLKNHHQLNKQQQQYQPLRITQTHLNAQKDIFICKLLNNINNNNNNDNNEQQFQIKIIQIQSIITFYVSKYINYQCQIDTNNNVKEQGQQSMVNKDIQKYTKTIKILVDSFWINTNKYLLNGKKKLYTTYLKTDLSQESLAKIYEIYNNRLINRFIKNKNKNKNKNNNDNNKDKDKKGNNNDKNNLQQILLQCLLNNLLLFNKFLKPKQYSNLLTTNVIIYRSLHTQTQYKFIYEERWGRTGFQLEQRNWIKAYQNKIKNMKKMGKI